MAIIVALLRSEFNSHSIIFDETYIFLLTQFTRARLISCVFYLLSKITSATRQSCVLCRSSFVTSYILLLTFFVTPTSTDSQTRRLPTRGNRHVGWMVREGWRSALARQGRGEVPGLFLILILIRWGSIRRDGKNLLHQ